MKAPSQVKLPVERPKCRICETRAPRRFCPGVSGNICAPCCGTEREETIDCPLDCEYLIAAHQHSKPLPESPEIPHPDIRVDERFLYEQQQLLTATGRFVFMAFLEIGTANDFDIRDALESMIRSYRTRDSGLIYETRSANPLAAHIQARVEEGLHRIREEVAQQSGVHSIRDADVLRVLVFLARAERVRNNGRRRSRAFVSSLRELMPTQPANPERIILA